MNLWCVKVFWEADSHSGRERNMTDSTLRDIDFYIVYYKNTRRLTMGRTLVAGPESNHITRKFNQAIDDGCVLVEEAIIGGARERGRGEGVE